jgi:hypothetical protein
MLGKIFRKIKSVILYAERRKQENIVARGDGIHLEIRSCNSFVSLSSLRKFSLVYFKSGCGTISATDSVCSMWLVQLWCASDSLSTVNSSIDYFQKFKRCLLCLKHYFYNSVLLY